MTAVARRLNLTEGQLYTLATGVIVAVALLGLGLPRLDTTGAVAAAAASGPPVRIVATPGSPAIAQALSAPSEALPEVIPPALAVAPSAGPSPSPRAATIAPVRPGTTPPADPAPTASAPADAEPSTPRAAPGDPAVATTPLRVSLGRYLTSSTPLVPAGSPGQYLPVELRAGSIDKESFIRLTGTGSILDLALSVAPGHQVAPTMAMQIAACALLDEGWDLTDGGPLSTAPRIDGSACAVGEATSTGYRFDLSRVATTNGLALVASGATSSTGRITFLGASS